MLNNIFPIWVTVRNIWIAIQLMPQQINDLLLNYRAQKTMLSCFCEIRIPSDQVLHRKPVTRWRRTICIAWPKVHCVTWYHDGEARKGLKHRFPSSLFSRLYLIPPQTWRATPQQIWPSSAFMNMSINPHSATACSARRLVRPTHLKVDHSTFPLFCNSHIYDFNISKT